ncbi:MAG: hypothetical protein Q7V57_01700 [Actinomycetota bacterium]|nr:hypothetical protein [Actinomycetota bacterium]
MIALQLRADGMIWATIFAVFGLLLMRFVSGAWPWQGDEHRHDKRYYFAAVVLYAIGWIAVIAF